MPELRIWIYLFPELAFMLQCSRAKSLTQKFVVFAISAQFTVYESDEERVIGHVNQGAFVTSHQSSSASGGWRRLLSQALSLLENGVKMTSFKTIAEKLIAWRRYREAVRELSQLSDRDLSDIGIRRGDIEYVVRRSVASKADA